MPAAPPRQLNITVPENVAEELEAMALHSAGGMAGIMQAAFALVKIASDAKKNKQKLVVADQNGKPLQEIVLPR
jgi:hypothetical protein